MTSAWVSRFRSFGVRGLGFRVQELFRVSGLRASLTLISESGPGALRAVHFQT